MPYLHTKGRTKTNIPQKHYPRDDYSHGEFYGSAAWRSFAWRHKKNHPLCAACEKQRIITPAMYVDHVFPWRDKHSRFFANVFQSLCASHHRYKSSQDKQGYHHYWIKGKHLLLHEDDYNRHNELHHDVIIMSSWTDKQLKFLYNI
jgi:hypothetical protein